MSDNYVYTYATILSNAKSIKQKAEKEYQKPNGKWSYYICKAILKPKTSIKKITVNGADHSTGNDFSRQITKSQYIDMAKRLINFVEKNKKIPNYITVSGKNMRVSDYTYMFARILVYYNEHNQLPAYANVNSKVFVKPSETGNAVFDYWVKKFGNTPKTIDDVCNYILKHFDYEYYYDDHKSNKQVIDSKAGNCTDLSQMLSNMAEALGYEWKCIHTQCRQSGTGHVYLKLRKGGNWFTRDVACIADESRYCIWCDVDNGGGTLLATNPSWWLQNRQR